MGNLSRRSVLRSSLGLAAAGTLARPYVAKAAATTAEVWWVQGFVPEEDVSLKKVVAELKDTQSILFIDELHTLVGAGAAEGAVDAANILKPSLARGEPARRRTRACPRSFCSPRTRFRSAGTTSWGTSPNRWVRFSARARWSR